VYFGWREPNKPNQTGLSRKHVYEACHEALQRLQLDYLDLFFCHRPDPNVPIEEVVWTMHNLIQQGKILYWGTSQWSGAEIMEAHRVAQQYGLIGPVMEQPQYNMFERFKVELDYKPVYQNVGLGTTIWSPLAAGFLTGKYLDGIPADSRLAIEGFDWLKNRWLQEQKIEKLKKLMALANQLGVSIASLAIAWTIQNPNVTTAILGATRESQLTENLKALDVLPLLTPAVMAEIEAILQNKPVLDLS
jgi:voltage-dependent potassium channel beta subunit